MDKKLWSQPKVDYAWPQLKVLIYFLDILY